MGWDGSDGFIGNRFFKSTFGANKASVGSIFCKSGLEGLRKRKTILRVLGIGNQWTLRDAPHLQCPPSV